MSFCLGFALFLLAALVGTCVRLWRAQEDVTYWEAEAEAWTQKCRELAQAANEIKQKNGLVLEYARKITFHIDGIPEGTDKYFCPHCLKTWNTYEEDSCGRLREICPGCGGSMQDRL